MGQQEVGWKFEALVSNEEPDHFGSPKLGKGKKIKKARKSGQVGSGSIWSESRIVGRDGLSRRSSKVVSNRVGDGRGKRKRGEGSRV